MLEQTKAFLVKLWNDQDVQLMVLISLMVQLFLLFTGNRRRRRISGLLRLMIWLAYVGADAVAVFAIGLLAKYDEKYKLASRQLTEDHTLPFLWAPFLLLHLGGQDTITAFSMEDNNLWLRHLLKLVVQVALTLYAFWKSFDVLDFQLVAIAVPIFVAGLIKYGERTWALYSGSRDCLSSCYEDGALPDYNSTSCGDVVASYALNTVLRVRGLFVGRTLFQLGRETENQLLYGFQNQVQKEEGLKIIMAELGMMYDLLYTKAMVLQSRTGRIFRCIAETSIVVAFVLFLANHQLHAYNGADLIITYTLFAGALFTGSCSVSMLIVSAWTRARLKERTCLLWLSSSACSVLNALVHGACSVLNAIVQRQNRNMPPQQQQQQHMPSFSIGQFNLTDYSISQKRRPKLISKCISALGLEKQVRNILHVEQVKDKGIIAYIESLYSHGEGSQGKLELSDALIYVLKMPFEHALFRLHMFTDLYVSSIESREDEVALVKAECMILANYLMHLMLNCPYMLPVGTAAQDLEPTFTKWVREKCSGTMTKREILDQYRRQVLCKEREPNSVSPFQSLPQSEVSSLRTIKETWARLLIYAAGKCPMEMHARQLSNGVEPITFLSLLMLQHAEGDAGMREVSLFTSSDDPHQVHPAGTGTLVSMYNASWTFRQYGPRYAFEFRRHDLPSLSVAPWAPRAIAILQLALQRALVSLCAARAPPEIARCRDEVLQVLEQLRALYSLNEASVGSEMEQLQDHKDTAPNSDVEALAILQHALDSLCAAPALRQDKVLQILEQLRIILNEANVGSEMEQQQDHAALEDTSPNSDVAALAPEIDQVV